MRAVCACGLLAPALWAAGSGGRGPVPATPPDPAAHWTVLFYGAGADEKHLVKTVGVMKDHFADGQGVELVALIDRPGKYVDPRGVFEADFAGTRLYRITHGRATRLAGGERLPEITPDADARARTADPETLRRFVRYGKANYPARHYALVFFGHGSGWRFCMDRTPGAPLGAALQPTAISAALGREEAVDLVVFDVCFMGGAEIAYQWRPGNGRFEAAAMVAAPGLGDALPYDRILPGLRGDALDPAALTPLALGKRIVAETEAHRRDEIGREPTYSSEVLACYDLSRAADVKRAVDALAVELARADGARAALDRIRGSGTKPVVMNYLEPEGVEAGWAWVAVPYFDLYDLARRIRACPDLPGAVKDRAADVQRGVEGLVVASFGQRDYPGFEPGRNGLSITFPDGTADYKGQRHWERCRWYTPVAARGGDGLYGRWSWCRDGAVPGNGRVENWFELLDSWYDTTNDESGGCNGYRW